MYDDVEELLKIYELFISGLKFFSSSFEKQYINLKYAAMADELASDFTMGELPRAEILLRNDWITNEQFEKVVEIVNYLKEMNNKKDLWNEEAVKDAKEWEHCRQMAKDLLKTFKA